jgi:peptidoglycan/xylan/chitin deacetylase (PgdA/CDA1 family)
MAQSVSVARYAGNKQAALSLTFDDGLKEQYTILFPKLKELGIKGTFCLIGSRMDNSPSNPEKATFSWANAKEMSDDGQEITSHGWAHKNVSKLTAEALRYEVQHNDTVIYQHTGLFPRTYFYPGNRKSDDAVFFCSRNRVGTRTEQVSLGSKRTQEWFEKW